MITNTEQDMGRITERDFQLLRERSWEWADRRLRWQRFENWVLWPLAIAVGLFAIYEALVW